MLKVSCKTWQNSLRKKFEIADELRTQDEFCDITLQSVDKMNVRAHKLILIIGSNYFRDLFSSGMKESYAECIEYKQVRGDILQKVIDFLYTGEFFVDQPEKLEEIAICGNYFQLDHLIEECTNLLTDYITDENCLRYWRLARECFQKDFEKFCISYVFCSTGCPIENLSFFNDLDEDEVEVLLKDARLHWTEEIKFEKILNWSKTKRNNKDEFASTLLKLLEIIDFTALNREFILTNILQDDDLAEHKNIRKKIAEFLQEGGGQQNQALSSSSFLSNHFVLNTGKLHAIIGDELRTINSDDGTLSTLQFKENSLWNVECCVFKNSLFICGGRTELHVQSSGSNICEYYVPSRREWKDLPWMETQRFWHSCTIHENRIFVCGGITSGTTLSNVEIFDLNSEKWIQGQTMAAPRNRFGIAVVNRSLYAVGGFITKNIEMFDPRMDQWMEIHDGFETEDLTRCVSLDNQIYCFRRDPKPCIFDTRTNKMLDWEGAKLFVPVRKIFDFRVCAFDGSFNFIQHSNETETDIDFYRYSFNGDIMFSNTSIFHFNPFRPYGALATLNY